MKKILLIIFITVLGFSYRVCAETIKDDFENSIKGKFVIDSKRENTQINSSETYILQNGKLKKIGEKYANPKWSHDGTKLIASDPNKGLIYLMDESGKVLKEITTDYYSDNFNWFPDDKKIIFAEKNINENYISSSVYIYDFMTNQRTLVHSFQKNQHLIDLRLSHDGSKLAFHVGDVLLKNVSEQLGTIDLKTKEIRLFVPSLMVIGWMPDDINILVRGNKKNTNEKFNKRFGIIGVLNTKTGALKILREESKFYVELSLSSDGRYILYARQTKNGQCIFLNEIATDKEFQVTFPKPIGNTGLYSVDSYADWYQGN